MACQIKGKTFQYLCIVVYEHLMFALGIFIQIYNLKSNHRIWRAMLVLIYFIFTSLQTLFTNSIIYKKDRKVDVAI